MSDDTVMQLNDLFDVIFLLDQKRNGEDIPVAETKNINHRKFAASFRLREVTSQDQDLYRCVTQSERGSGVSNFAGLIVRGKCCFVIYHHTVSNNYADNNNNIR